MVGVEPRGGTRFGGAEPMIIQDVATVSNVPWAYDGSSDPDCSETEELTECSALWLLALIRSHTPQQMGSRLPSRSTAKRHTLTVVGTQKGKPLLDPYWQITGGRHLEVFSIGKCLAF